MKIQHLLASLTLVAMSLTATSCSDEPEGYTPAATVAATYSGDITYVAAGQTIGPVYTDVILVARGPETVSITLKGDPTNPSMQAFHQDLVVEGCKVIGSDVTYTLTDTKIDAVVDDVNYVGTVNGTVLDRDISLKYTLTPGAMPFPMVGTFKGKRK